MITSCSWKALGAAPSPINMDVLKNQSDIMLGVMELWVTLAKESSEGWKRY